MLSIKFQFDLHISVTWVASPSATSFISISIGATSSFWHTNTGCGINLSSLLWTPTHLSLSLLQIWSVEMAALGLLIMTIKRFERSLPADCDQIVIHGGVYNNSMGDAFALGLNYLLYCVNARHRWLECLPGWAELSGQSVCSRLLCCFIFNIKSQGSITFIGWDRSIILTLLLPLVEGGSVDDPLKNILWKSIDTLPISYSKSTDCHTWFGGRHYNVVELTADILWIFRVIFMCSPSSTRRMTSFFSHMWLGNLCEFNMMV